MVHRLLHFFYQNIFDGITPVNFHTIVCAVLTGRVQHGDEQQSWNKKDFIIFRHKAIFSVDGLSGKI
jgi:hypothetical protein